MSPAVGGLVLAVTAGLLAPACNALFGTADLEYRDRQTANAGGATGSTVGSGGAGGASSSTATTSSTSVTVGTGGSGGAGGSSLPPPNYALRFDGIDDVVFVASPVTTDFTIELWFRTTASGPSGQFYQSAGLFYADIPSCDRDFALGILDDGCSFGVSPGGSGGGCSHPTHDSSATVTTGNWIHAAAWRDANTGDIGLYINGVSDGSRATSADEAMNSLEAFIGGRGAGSLGFFEGDIDEVRVWNYVRSESEVAATMAKPLVGNEPGLLSYWRFDEGSGNMALDATSSDNDGLLGNGFGSQPEWISPGAPVSAP